MITIEFWSDFMCPFCYIGEKRVKDVVKAMGLEDKVTYKMKAFELDPTTSDNPVDKAIPLMAKRHNLTIEEAERRAQYIEKLAHEVGLNYHYADMQFVNSLKAHKLVKYAQTLKEPHKVNELIDQLFKSVFIDGKNIADDATLIDIALQCGFNNRDQITQAIQSTIYEPMVRQEEMELGQLGVTSVPLFIIGNKGIPGVPSTESLKSILQDIVEEQKIEFIDDQNNPPISCSIDGCSI